MFKTKKYMLLMAVVMFIFVFNSMAFGQCLTTKSVGPGAGGWSSAFTACDKEVKNTLSFKVEAVSYQQQMIPGYSEDGYERSRTYNGSTYSNGTYVDVWWFTLTTKTNQKMRLQTVPYQAPDHGFTNSTYKVQFYANQQD